MRAMTLSLNQFFKHQNLVAMATRNLVSIKISKDNKTKIDAAVVELNQLLKPMLISLTPQQRREVPKMGDRTAPLVEKILDYARSNPEFTPPYMDVDEMEVDLKAVDELQSIYRPLLQLMQQLDDSILLSGSEAYVASLAYYNSVKVGARMNVRNAKAIFRDLQQRFKSIRGVKAEEESDE